MPSRSDIDWMGTPLRLLMVEDSAEDAELVLRELRRGGYEPTATRVDTADALEAAFPAQHWDLVLVDFTMPRFSGRKALEMVRARDHDVPFIYVSGTIGEDMAVAAMKAGAHDYIMKGNLKRLLPAIDRELKEAQERRDRRRAEHELRLMQTIALAVTEAPDVHAALGVALRLICEATGCEAGQAWVPDSSGDVLECSPAWYGPGGNLEALRTASLALSLKPGTGLPGRVWATKQPVWVDDLVREEISAQDSVLRAAPTTAAVGIPVLAGAEVAAVLELFMREIGARERNLACSLVAVAAQLGGVIQRKRAESRLSYLAHYDVLTNLPNRVLFNDRLHQAVIDANRHGRLVAVAFVDLDRFKAINDTLGHDVGDELLQAVAQRLCACVRENDTVARLSGDEFTVVLGDMAQADHGARIARKIVDSFARPFQLAGRELFVTPSLGMALYPTDATTIDGLLRNADIAMYRAKEAGGNSYQFYRAEMTHKAAERLAMENGLRRAVERNELLLHYQPKAEISTGRITGVEALVRWQPHSTRMVSPVEFVPLAEETGLIVPIGDWVLNCACGQAKRWQQAGLSGGKVAVNLSARQLRQADLVESVGRALEETGLEPRWLELEITESLLMQNNRESVAMLNELNALGTRLVLDDFGTGYSSLSYLKRFPVHALKIDQSFVRDIPADTDNAAIARAIIALAHSLGLKVIAEGVETPEQLDFLREHSCDEMQGFLLGMPLATDDATAMLGNGGGERGRRMLT
jgi:diguanylate cyclase (GGDEF)-like protein